MVNEQLLSRNAKITLIALVVTGAMLYFLADVVAPVAFAFLIAYFFDPLIDKFETRKYSRTLAIGIVLLTILVILTVFLLIFIPMIEIEISRFISRLPGLMNTASTRIDEWLAKLTNGQDSNSFIDQAITTLTAYVNNLKASDLAPVTGFLKKTFSSTTSILGALFTVALVPLFAFYFLRDFDIIKLYPLKLVPTRHQKIVVEIARDIDAMLANFIRGQVTVCLILAVAYGLGYQLVGVPLGLLIGLIAGFFSFIPYVGPGIGVGLSLVMVLLDWQGWGPLIGLSIVYVVVQLLEGYVLTPRIVGDKVGLSPVLVIIALLAGGELFGFTGILVAVPAAAVLKILAMRAIASYQKTAYYNGDGA